MLAKPFSQSPLQLQRYRSVVGQLRLLACRMVCRIVKLADAAVRIPATFILHEWVRIDQCDNCFALKLGGHNKSECNEQSCENEELWARVFRSKIFKGFPCGCCSNHANLYLLFFCRSSNKLFQRYLAVFCFLNAYLWCSLAGVIFLVKMYTPLLILVKQVPQPIG